MKLAEVFTDCEDMEDVESLKTLAKLFKNIGKKSLTN